MKKNIVLSLLFLQFQQMKNFTRAVLLTGVSDDSITRTQRNKPVRIHSSTKRTDLLQFHFLILAGWCHYSI